MSIDQFKIKKTKQLKITAVACYAYWEAKIIDKTSIDLILVGDSASMVMHGHSTTIPISVDEMVTHIRAVARGCQNKLIIGDMPFCSFRKSLSDTMESVVNIIQAGAHAVKLEGAVGNIETIQHIVQSGIPVMGHIGLTPQFYHQLGGFRVQGTQAEQANEIIAQAKLLEQAGCFAVVLECIPSELAKTITNQLKISTIGIGAGPHTDGQILVLHDLLGFTTHDFQPKFLKTYLNGEELIKSALEQYCHEVTHNIFPEKERSYHYRGEKTHDESHPKHFGMAEDPSKCNS